MSGTAPWTVILADDHPVVLNGLAQLIGSREDFAIFGRFLNGEDALQAICEHRPDVTVIDVYMPGLNGLEVLAAVKKQQLPTRVILLTAGFEDDNLLEAMETGADGIILKEAAPEVLLNCLLHVAQGGRWIAPEYAGRAGATGGTREGGTSAAATPLTAREAQLARLVVNGLSNKDIGRQLTLTEGTVKSHLHNIYAKLGVANRTTLASMFLGRHTKGKAGRT